jgi:hypothetical protein
MHGTYRHRKRHPSRRAERQNPHSGSTVALRGFVQDGFCNGCPLRDHAAIALASSHHRNLNIGRPSLTRLVFDASRYRNAGGESRHRNFRKNHKFNNRKKEKTKSQISKPNKVGCVSRFSFVPIDKMAA